MSCQKSSPCACAKISGIATGRTLQLARKRSFRLFICSHFLPEFPRSSFSWQDPSKSSRRKEAAQKPLDFSRQTITWPMDFLFHRLFHSSIGQQLSKNNFHLRWRRRLSFEEAYFQTSQFVYLASEEPIITQISKRKWRWIGHILRKPANNITRQALRWNPQGKRKRGRPRNSWRRGVESQMRNWGHTWATLGRFAQDRTRWRTEVVNGLCSNRS